MKRVSGLFLILFFLLSGGIHAEGEWTLVRDDQGIQVDTRNVPGSPLWACKVVCGIEAPLEAVREMLLDTETTTLWYHHCRECRVLRHDKEGRDFLFYFVFQGIWPVADRDLVAFLRITRNDSEEFSCRIEAMGENSEAVVPLNRHCVRVTRSDSTFRLLRSGKGRTLLVHEAVADPSGIVPAFLVNRYMAWVPFQTLRNMRAFLTTTDKYYKMAGIPKDI